MAFRTSDNDDIDVESPEALFSDIRSKKVTGLLSQQADVLRIYTSKAVSAADVALQLPTGSGKTLVALLVGEWRRRKRAETILYLCPTNQLVYQVAAQANDKYGIRAIPFTGPKRDYAPDAKTSYLSADVVAVTSYSALFNTRPFFETPKCIILDDVHAAENYISSMFSLRISRTEPFQEPLFDLMFSVLRTEISVSDFTRVVGLPTDATDANWVNKLPTPKFMILTDEIRAIIDEHAESAGLAHQWSTVRDHLTACHLFYSLSEILLRPIIPPTQSHTPFSGATQRIYMSATLGKGGDLERITGRPSIQRLATPELLERHDIGRRFFVFPDTSLQSVETEKLKLQMIAECPRALWIVPSDFHRDQVESTVQADGRFRCFAATEIEHSKSAFIESEKSIALVANRYDGIDFPENECRLLIIDGLPKAVNLLEKFLVYRLGLSIVLDDRMLTRIVQAFGRCTRSPQDYSCVVVTGDDVFTYLISQDKRRYLRPELQAEIEVGTTQSRNCTAHEFVENLQLFLKQGQEWQAVDKSIIALRSDRVQHALPGTSDLAAVVSSEIDYANAMWNAHYRDAFDACRSILGQLNDPELRGYRAFWNYLAGSALCLLNTNDPSRTSPGYREYFDAASKGAPGVPWLSSLAVAPPKSTKPQYDPRLLTVVERIAANLQRHGTANNRNYDAAEHLILDGIASSFASTFEEAQKDLGRFIGFDAGRATDDQGAPDPWWFVDDKLCIVFEDYTDHEPASSLSVTKARQVSSHPDWIRHRFSTSHDAMIIPVLVTGVTRYAQSATPHLGGVSCWQIDNFREWAKKSLRTIRDLRRDFRGEGDLVWQANAAQTLVDQKLDPDSLVEFLKSNLVLQVFVPVP